MKDIGVYYNGQDIGRLAYDEKTDKSFFQYNPAFLQEDNYKPLFPFLLKKTKTAQVFTTFNGDTFKGIPPMFADSLPDLFGNVVFKEWMNANDKTSVSPVEQLAYVGSRGMGALEYRPSKAFSKRFENSVNIDEMTELSKRILDIKNELSTEGLSHESLLNMFRIGTSAGGARPKILVSEEKATGRLIPGDVNYADDYNHYLIKLAIDSSYPAEIIEYCYYDFALSLGIDMQSSKLIDGKHFCTLRFDREDGKKKHILTASGLTGWDFKKAENSSYENLFMLSTRLRVPHVQIESLFQRMVFNVVFLNVDDHLKNHSFIYDDSTCKWNLAPAYDVTFALNPLLHIKKISRALSINGKTNDILIGDLLTIADTYAIKNAKNIIERSIQSVPNLKRILENNKVPSRIINAICGSIDLNISILLAQKKG